MQLDKRHPVPVYRQLGEHLKSQINQGIYGAHQQLPSERELCQQFNLSRMTARRALLELVNEGWAYTCAGKGTFVSELPSNAATQECIARKPLFHLVDDLVDSLVSFDCVGVESITSNALAEYPIEMVALQIFPAVLRRVATLRSEGAICLQAEHFANNTIRAKLMGFFNACKPPASPQKVMVGCAPGDQHEVAAILLAISLRQRGYSVIFMGQDVPAQQFANAIKLVKPKLICFSATMEASVQSLADLAASISEIGQEAPHLGFGGQVFLRKPVLRRNVNGIYLGESVEAGISHIQDIVSP
ncbi:MAG: GntR family transcriptional regulator [Anaerolineae bacterium]